MLTSAPTWLRTGAVGLAGLAAGGILTTTVSATASDSGDGDTGTLDGTTSLGDRSPRFEEEPLTGDTADRVREAALAEHPGATVLRLETDSDGVYEAHLVRADGTPVTVLVNEDFEVTGEEVGGFGHGFGHGFGPPGGSLDCDRDLPGAPAAPDAAEDGATESSST